MTLSGSTLGLTSPKLFPKPQKAPLGQSSFWLQVYPEHQKGKEGETTFAVNSSWTSAELQAQVYYYEQDKIFTVAIKIQVNNLIMVIN